MPITTFVVSTTESIALSIAFQAKHGLEKPLKFAEAEITKAMMKEIYLELALGDAGYDAKYREISHLRRLGRHLDILVSKFGLAYPKR